MTGLLSYAEHLEWIVGALGRADVPAERGKWMAAKLDRARERMADPELHIAVLGETSSGKSTLLNAFLRQRLLPSSALVTTRTTLTIRHGYDARLTDGTMVWPRSRTAARQEDLAGALKRLLTTDAADSLHDLELSWPSALLGEGVTITDTPGFSVDDEGHRDRAVAAAERADLVLVVIPAVAAMSLALAEFLSGPLHDHHDRCAFVLTKIDMVESGERADVIDATVRRLRELGIEDPAVFPCVPESVLRTVADPDAGRPFVEVEAELVALTEERRQAAIAATLLSLLTELLRAVEQAAVQRGERLAAAEREMAHLSVPDLRTFLETWSQEAVSDGIRAIGVAWDASSHRYFATDLDDRLRTAIEQDSVTTGSEMAKAAVETVRYHLGAETGKVLSDACSRANEALRESATELAEEFADQYGRLARLVDSERATPAPPSISTTSLSIPDLDDVDETLTSVGARLSSSAVLKTGGGAALGAAAGTMFIPIPVLGTVLGMLVGGIIGAPGIMTMRSQFAAQTAPILADVRSDMATVVGEAVDPIFADYTGRVDGVCRTYLRDWLDDVESLAQQEARSRATLAMEIAVAATTVKSARERREQIVQLRAAMSRPPVGIGAGEAQR